jgi:hypothetical protein
VAVAQLRAEDEAGRVRVPIERVEISHAARAGVVPDCSGCQIADKQFNLRPEDLMLVITQIFCVWFGGSCFRPETGWELVSVATA